MGRDGFQHIGQVIRQKYPENRASELRDPHPSMYPALNDTAIAVATCIVLTAMPAAIYLLASEKLLSALAALVTALGAAFGPKIYADFIQPNNNSQPPAPGS